MTVRGPIHRDPPQCSESTRPRRAVVVAPRRAHHVGAGDERAGVDFGWTCAVSADFRQRAMLAALDEPARMRYGWRQLESSLLLTLEQPELAKSSARLLGEMNSAMSQ